MQVNIRASYIRSDSPAMVALLERFQVPPSNSLLLMLEQTIALESTAFIGTPSSSATWVGGGVARPALPVTPEWTCSSWLAKYHLVERTSADRI